MARRNQAVTIKHVAKDAGVSLQTVSRVINQAPNVRAEMAERVQASIDRLGYVPSIAAQRMSGSHSYLILAVNDRDRTIADWRERKGSDWLDQMLLGGMLKCAEHGYRLIFELVDTHGDHVERELRAAIAALQPDGIILTPPHSHDPHIVALLDRQRIPFARIGTRQHGPGIALTMGDESSARLVTQHLLDLGHRRIGFIGGAQDYELSAWRLDGWRGAMADAGLDTEALLTEGDFTFASGELAAQDLLGRENRPTAIIACSDQMALATLKVAQMMQLEVPDDLSIVSFDNTPQVRYAQPPLTAVDQPIAATTARAVELIIAAKKEGTIPAGRTVIPATLCVRESVAPPPAAHQLPSRRRKSDALMPSR